MVKVTLRQNFAATCMAEDNPAAQPKDLTRDFDGGASVYVDQDRQLTVQDAHKEVLAIFAHDSWEYVEIVKDKPPAV